MSNSINNIQSRKRKQPINDSSLFLAPSIPAKRSSSLAMFFPKTIPSNGLIMMPFNSSKLIQTDPTFSFLTLASHHQYDIEQEKLKAQINELHRTKSDIHQQYESTVETIKRCLMMTRSLLIEKSQLEKKQVREKAMENRLRLGQFVTQRQGVSFVEQWINGFEFSDKQRAKEQLIRSKDNLNKERKTLTKKKTFLQQQQQQQQLMIDETHYNNNSNFNAPDLFNSIYIPPTKLKRINKNSTIKTFTR
jgi:tousled-like kinase